MTSKAPRKKPHPLTIVAATLAAAASVGVLVSSIRDTTHVWGLPSSSPAAQRPPKVRIEGDHQYLWAQGDRTGDPEQAEWFDLTGSPLDIESFQFGIGKDSIASIDRPVFVAADDPRLFARTFERYGAVDQLRVIGFVLDGDARAYPIDLMNRHELVNDTVAGKPITIGW